MASGPVVSGPVVYLLRHGETEWNLERRRQGHLDSPLTERGAAQAREAGLCLVGELGAAPQARLACSPLGRARRTAEIVAGCLGLSSEAFEPDARLAEHHLGEWQGKTDAEVDARHPGGRAARARDRWHYRIPGGESYELLADRARDWLESLSGDSLVVAVGHEMINRTILGGFCSLSPEETLALRHPHSVVYRLQGGEMVRLASPGGPSAFEHRAVTPADHDWLFDLHCRAMRPWVEQTWGWDDAWQRRHFDDHFEPLDRELIVMEGEPVGMLHVVEEPSAIFLAAIEIDPGHQGRGLGTRVIEAVLARASARTLPVRLRVLRVNPARALYERLGFEVVGETETHVEMRAHPPGSSGGSPER